MLAVAFACHIALLLPTSDVTRRLAAAVPPSCCLLAAPASALPPPSEGGDLFDLLLGGTVLSSSVVDAASLIVGVSFLAYASTTYVFATFDGGFRAFSSAHGGLSEDVPLLTSSRRNGAGKKAVSLVEASHWRPLPSLEEISQSCYCIADEGLCRWFLCTSPTSEDCSPDDSFSAYYGRAVYLCQM